MIDDLLLTIVQLGTFAGDDQPLTQATGFFFSHDDALFVVTNRHVVLDEVGNHHPEQLQLRLHTDADNLTLTETCRIPLYDNATPIWRQATDSGGTVDIVAIPVDVSVLPSGSVYRAFGREHLPQEFDRFEIGSPLSIVGFPLGFHDTLHQLPVARQASVASAFGFRFQGQGFFLTDARMHRGASGSPVVSRCTSGAIGRSPLPWQVVGVHASRFDVGTRDLQADEALGLNAAWYTDVIVTLTDPPPEVAQPDQTQPVPAATTSKGSQPQPTSSPAPARA